jgi:hypothetical protein
VPATALWRCVSPSLLGSGHRRDVAITQALGGVPVSRSEVIGLISPPDVRGIAAHPSCVRTDCCECFPWTRSRPCARSSVRSQRPPRDSAWHSLRSEPARAVLGIIALAGMTAPDARSARKYPRAQNLSGECSVIRGYPHSQANESDGGRSPEQWRRSGESPSTFYPTLVVERAKR